MSLYTIGDLHLSLGANKPMDVFRGWNNYVQRLEENWCKTIQPEDTVVLAGDSSWGIDLSQSKEDFSFIERLPGRKILLKGNHDYWFSTKKKVEDFFAEHGFTSMHLLHNNAYEHQDVSLCGTRGWMYEPGEEKNHKVMMREVGRLKLSLEAAKKPPIVFMHYPPLFAGNRFEEIMELLQKYQVKQVYYGHLHAQACKAAVQGIVDGVLFELISADYRAFMPFKIK